MEFTDLEKSIRGKSTSDAFRDVFKNSNAESEAAFNDNFSRIAMAAHGQGDLSAVIAEFLSGSANGSEEEQKRDVRALYIAYREDLLRASILKTAYGKETVVEAINFIKAKTITVEAIDNLPPNEEDTVKPYDPTGKDYSTIIRELGSKENIVKTLPGVLSKGDALVKLFYYTGNTYREEDKLFKAAQELAGVADKEDDLRLVNNDTLGIVLLRKVFDTETGTEAINLIYKNAPGEKKK